MALLQTDHENAAFWMGAPQSRPMAHGFSHLAAYLAAPISTVREGLQHWSIRRAVRSWRIATERARQRRALAQLSDRELRDIGITRYEIDFVLRQGRWR